jgi:hypothetical protein
MRLAARVVEEYNLTAEVDDSGRSISVRISPAMNADGVPQASHSAKSEVGPNGGPRWVNWLSRLFPNRKHCSDMEEASKTHRELWQSLAFTSREDRYL